MPWQCRMVANRDDAYDEIGNMYFSEHYDENHTAEFEMPLSPEYRRDWYGKRSPLFVMTPAGPWCVDAQSTDGNGNFTGHGWTVTGLPPNITVSPSINFPGSYHGWLTDGVLSGDIDGRKFD